VNVDTGIVTKEAITFEPSMRQVRRVDWVTFGGVYIRREVLDMVGPMDPRYEWAYVMDVDYSLEVSMRGLSNYQVPVRLLHWSNGTTGQFLTDPIYLQKVEANFGRFYQKWGAYLARFPNGINSEVR
jgi:GT2 family glycosyltransferase